MDLEVSIQPLFAMKLTEKIKMAIIENNEFRIGIFLDLSTAFDTINHNIQLEKLGFYGIRGLCNDWFRIILPIGSKLLNTIPPILKTNQ